MTAVDLYDFEGNMATTFTPILIAAGLTALTQLDPAAFQKDRPRCEVIFRTGSAVSPPRIGIVTPPPAVNRAIMAYTGELEINSITPATVEGKSLHSAYRAAIRQAMELDKIRTSVNTASNPYQIDFVTPSGSTQSIKTDDGYEMSRLTYAIQFSIKLDAFVQLAAS